MKLLSIGILIAFTTVANAELCIRPIVSTELQAAHDVCATSVPGDQATKDALAGCKEVWAKWNEAYKDYYKCSEANTEKLKAVIEKGKQ